MSAFLDTNEHIIVFDSVFRVLICTLCECAVVPREVSSHLRSLAHRNDGLTWQQHKDLAVQCLTYPCAPPEQVRDMQMSDPSPVVPLLRLYTDSFSCKLCPAAQPYVSPNKDTFRHHLKAEHKWTRRKGRQSAAAQATLALETVAVFPITCQTFFRRSTFLRYFQVQPALIQTRANTSPQGLISHPPVLSITEQVQLQLDKKLAQLDSADSNCPAPRHFTQVSPWLDTTQWMRYLEGHDLAQAATLVYLPEAAAAKHAAIGGNNGFADLHLLLLLDSFDRVIETARESLLQDKVNVFDQHRVNSFISKRSSSRPLWHKLKEPTYRTYKKVWKQLLCFVYRLAWQKKSPELHYFLTPAQDTALEAVLRAAASLAQQQDLDQPPKPGSDWHQELDRACLLLCIALLDHQLHGNIYDSVVVGFFAVLGINSQGTYHEATTYTPSLSAFVKLAQLLVVQRAVLAVEADEVDHAADILDTMQDRFMVYGTRSPIRPWLGTLSEYHHFLLRGYQRFQKAYGTL
jgi:hypothetical protein